MPQDPRMQGFNYGAALGAPRSAFYLYWNAVAGLVRHRKTAKATADCWNLDTQLRAVRAACTPAEQRGALISLHRFVNTVGIRVGARQRRRALQAVHLTLAKGN